MDAVTSGNSASSDGETAGLTAKVLASRAAAAALSGPAVSPGQWVYRKYAVVATPDNAARPVTAERWATADHATAAAYLGGQLEVGPWTWRVNPAGEISKSPIAQPAVSYGSLTSLPSRPRALLSLLGQTPVTRARAWRAGHAFELVAELFQSYVMPPQSAAQMYRALGEIRRVMADEHAIDVSGRHGTGFLLTGTGGNQEIIVDRRTHHFAGYQFLGSGRDIHAEGAWVWPFSVKRSYPGRGHAQRTSPNRANRDP